MKKDDLLQKGSRANALLGKIWKIMRLTGLFLLISFVAISAGTYSQNTRFSFKMENSTLNNLFLYLEQNSGYRFAYNKSDLDDAQKISCEFTNESIDQILKKVLDTEKLSVSIKNEYIIITGKNNTLGDSMPSSQSVKNIFGKVTDSSGAPLPGVSVIIKGTTSGVITDADGKFTLAKVPEDATLQISFVGMKTQEVTVSGKSNISVTLVEETVGIEEVVAVGYGTQKKVNITGSVDVISKAQLQQRTSGNVSQSIRGLSPGMNFSINSQGFQPGADMAVTIRGIGSLNGGTPYVLIDGFPGDMNVLNPEDIESISVLKDAAASAIYGARAAYGVILITTKKGEKSEKMHFTYSGQVMINRAQKLPTPLDSYTYERVNNEAGRNAGGTPFNNASIDRVVAYQNQDWDLLHQLIPNYPEGADIKSGAYPNGNKWDSANLGFANNNYWDIYWGSSFNQKHDLSVQGGTDKASYYLSGGYLDQNGVINYGIDNFKRFNLLGKVTIAVTDWWNFSWETRFSQKNRERSSYWNGGSYTNALQYTAKWVYPFSPLYDGYGNYSHASMIPFLLSGTERIKNIDNWNNLKTEIHLLKGWKINADFAYNTQSNNTSNAHLTAWEYYTDNTPFAMAQTMPTNLTKQKYDNYYWNTNIYTTYSFDLNEANHFSIMAGMQFEKGTNDLLWGYKTNLIVEDVPSFQTATGTAQLSETLNHNATQGYFGRLNYNFKEKYLFEANARYDGTYVFKKGNRWGFFPSASVGWNVHKESFWKGVEPYVNTLKLKASYGELGNQNVNPYSDLELIPIQSGKLDWIFSPNAGRRIGYTSAPGIVNQNLTWETATTRNLGIETSFLQNRLHANMDVFERLTTKMIGPSEAKPGVLGASVPSANNSTLRTRGWEVSLSWKHNLSKDFSYFANLNISDYKSIVTKYNNPTGTLSTWYEGKEVGEIWGYTVNDLFRTQTELDNYLAKTDLRFLGAKWRTGDVKYEDINGDGKVNNGTNTVANHGDLSIIGSDQPHYLTGLTLGFNYKGIDFSALFTGVLKRHNYFGSGASMYWGFNAAWYNGNLQKENLDYFRDEPGTEYIGLYEGDANLNTDAYWPRPYLNGTEENKNKNNVNTRYLVNTSYVRITNVQLGYTIPRILTSKLHLEKVRVYFSGENLFTFSKLPAGIDPEILNGGVFTYGADRVCAFGLTISY